MSTETTEATTFDIDDALLLPDERFAPKNVAIVTGGGSGIGRATTLVLAANGLTVVAVDIDEDGLEGTASRADELSADGSVDPVVGDLRLESDIEAVVREAADIGAIRYVANIAGLQHIDSIDEFPTGKWDLMHDVMLRGPFLIAKHTIPEIRHTDDGVGAIGNMASIHGHIATQDKAAYISAKFGLRGLTGAIAAEGAGTLRAFSVSTGYVKTPLVTNQIPDTAENRGISEESVVEDVMLDESRVKEMMTPTDVANLFTFGFSSHGSHLNGGDLTFDGGHLSTYQ